ncbi:MAG: ADP-ribosylation factor-like protein [archaeon]
MAQSTIKIILIGLDNSGKSSIALCLQRKNNLSNFTSLGPTRGHEVLRFRDKKTKTKISIWDLGGQKQHRTRHIEKLADEFSVGASKLIYVIDVQDSARYDLSLDYFKKVLKELQKVEIDIDISVFLHKYDPNIDFDEEQISTLMKKIKTIIPPTFEFNIFKTSIHTIFSKKLAY